MTDRELLLNSQRWRDRALEARTMARNATQSEDQQRLLKVARGYDRFALRTEDCKTAEGG